MRGERGHRDPGPTFRDNFGAADATKQKKDISTPKNFNMKSRKYFILFFKMTVGAFKYTVLITGLRILIQYLITIIVFKTLCNFSSAVPQENDIILGQELRRAV